MDIALFDRNQKSFITRHRSKIRSNQAGNGSDKRRPLTAFNHGRPSAYTRASRVRSDPYAGKPSKNTKRILSSVQSQIATFAAHPEIVQLDENEDYVNSRFRFMIRNGAPVDEDGEVPWDRVEHVRVPAFDVNYACPICLDHPVAARITRCGHIFCFPCLLHHLEEWSICKCPLCFASMTEDDLRSMEFVKVQAVHEGDFVQMCLLTRMKSKTHPRPADPNRKSTFSRFIKTDSIEDIVQRELSELKSAADSCDCSITAAFINNAAQSIHSRASNWTYPLLEEMFELGDESDQGPSEAEFYFFYQVCDGSPVFMHSLNYRSLFKEYGSDFPTLVCGKVLEVMQYEQTEDNRSRFRFLRHLPLSTIFYIVEMDISDFLSNETIQKFVDETDSRQLAREEKQRQSELTERRQKRRSDLLQHMPITTPLYKHDVYPVPEVGSIESFPSLSSTSPLKSSHINTHRPRWASLSSRRHQDIFQADKHSDDDENESDGLHSSNPPDWNLIHFQITTKRKQRKQKPKQRPNSAGMI